MSEEVALLPSMTAAQIAAWCAKHKMFVTINYITDHEGFLAPLITARREYEEGHVPAFLRMQAD